MNYAKELTLAKNIALEAGDIMLEHFQIGVPSETKADFTPVTLADHAINKLVIDKIAENFPEHSVLGEEASNIIEGSEYTWVCDPIDGTIPYSFGLATNAFSLILTRLGMPVTGVVCDPHLKRLFWATKGEGAWLDGKRLRVNDKPLAESIICPGGRRSAFIDTTHFQTEVYNAAHRLMNFGSSVYDGMLVSAGQLAACVYVSDCAHDVVAAKLFVEEAGGKATDLFGNDQRYDQPVKGIIASNGVIHDELVSFARSSMLES